jgi:hypothetical protein
MRNYLIFCLIIISFLSKSQERKDVGILVGTSYYMGDFNLGTQFYQPSPAFGAIFRQNFSDFYSIRVSSTFSWVRGKHDESNFYLPPQEAITFTTKIVEFEGAVEIGFLPFSTSRHTHRPFSPYVTIGFGGAFIMGNHIKSKIIPHIPFGVGLKYSPINRLCLGAEWRIHKTFYDEIDGYINYSKSNKSIIHNNDWFGIAGIFVTYRLFNQGVICPAYK